MFIVLCSLRLVILIDFVTYNSVVVTRRSMVTVEH